MIQSADSRRSDMSRVSLTIHNGLTNSEWKIERQALQLGKRLGKGGFGERSIPSRPLRQGYVHLSRRLYEHQSSQHSEP